MIKLHGIPVSNYYNMVKLALLEKAADFEEVSDPASQDADYKKKSPMGKMPFIETPSGYLAETSAILDYIEATHASPALYPADPFQRAKTQELMRIIEHYVELAARRHYGHVFFKLAKSDAAVEEVRPVIENGLAAIQQLGKFAPFIMGSEFTYADVVAHNSFGYANTVTQAVYDWDIAAAVPGLGDSLQAIAARPTTQKCDADQQTALKAFMAA